MIKHGEPHPENLIPGRKWRVWFNPGSPDKWFKAWRDTSGRIHYNKRDILNTKKVYWMIMSIGNRYLIKESDHGYLHQIHRECVEWILNYKNRGQAKDYIRQEITWLMSLVSPETTVDEEFKKQWKEMTLAVIEYVLSLIPSLGLEDDIVSTLKDLLLRFADWYYDQFYQTMDYIIVGGK